jgi:hypothetical protein
MSQSHARSKPKFARQPPSGSRGAARRAPRATKISVTVDDGVLREVKKDARRSGRSLSAQITDALARDLRRRRLQELIEQYEREHGLISDEELSRARGQWGD